MPSIHLKMLVIVIRHTCMVLCIRPLHERPSARESQIEDAISHDSNEDIGTPPPGSTTASKRRAIALNTVQPSDTVLHGLTTSSALTPLNLEKHQNYVTNQNAESVTPSQNPEQPQLFNPEGVESSILSITFVGVVPVAAMLAFVVVKMFRWQQRKQKRGPAIGRNGVKRKNSEPYLQPKAELDAEQARQEIEARERRYEMDGADAVLELPVAHDGPLSLGLAHELKGDEHSTELEVPER